MGLKCQLFHSQGSETIFEIELNDNIQKLTNPSIRKRNKYCRSLTRYDFIYLSSLLE